MAEKTEIRRALMAGIAQAKSLQGQYEILKLHIGCGTVYKDGWINIDNNSDNNIARLDLAWDLHYPLPFSDNTVDFIFHEHFLEHLDVASGLRALTDFRRVLKVGGIMRVAIPDLQGIIAAYQDADWIQNNKEFLQKYGLGFVKTNAEMLNINMRAWGHQWLYDWEELERRLKEVGFSFVKQEQIYMSDSHDLQNLETRAESTLIAEVIK